MSSSRVIAVISQKGGAGKTTVCLNLAVEAARLGGGAAILDIDPQASATAWSDLRTAACPAVRSCAVGRLAHNLGEASERADWIFIDTEPHAEGAALAAARAADLVLIPCRPALFDLHAISASIDLALLAGKPPRIVLNAVPPRGGTAAGTRTALVEAGYEVTEAALGQRAAFVHSLTAGASASEFEPKGKAAEEVRSLFAELGR